MKDVLACLYSSQPSLIAATQAFAAKRMEIGSISFHRYATLPNRVPAVSQTTKELPDT
jgi:hypothetical protein